MANKRVFYACQAVAFAGYDESTDTAVMVPHFAVAKGVQSIGITTNFNLEQVFELGQIQIYENIEGVPDVEVTIEKVFDGTPTLFALATPVATQGSLFSLVSRSKERCTVGLSIYDDSVDGAVDRANGNAALFTQEVVMKGMYVSSLSYNIPVDGPITESISLVGNNKVHGGESFMANAPGKFDVGGDDLSANQKAAGGIQRRENVDVGSSILPTALPGVDSDGTFTTGTGDTLKPTAHVQNISISTDFSREDILELGRKGPYYRAPSFPIEVTCDIEMIAIATDQILAFEEGKQASNNQTFVNAYGVGDVNLGTGAAGISTGDNTPEEAIQILLEDGTSFDLGAKNRLSSVTYGGGDSAGGNATVTYSYTNFNELLIS